MKRTIQAIALLIAVFSVTSSDVQAGQITTLFDVRQGGSVGGTAYFDIDVLSSNGINVEKLLTNAGGSFVDGRMDVYTRSGTYSGFETNASGWILISSGLGDSAGIDNPSEFDIADFFLAQGVTGIAIASEVGVWRHNYSFGTGANQFYSNSDVSLTLGSETNGLFGGSGGRLRSPRVWNGTIEYSVVAPAVPEPSSLAIFGIGACFMGFAGRRRRETRSVAKA